MKKILLSFLNILILISIFSAIVFFFSIFIDNTRSASKPPENPLSWDISPEQFDINLKELQKHLYGTGVVRAENSKDNTYTSTPIEVIPVNNDEEVIITVPVEQPIEIPPVIQNPYDFLGVKFNEEQQIDIVFFTDTEQIPVIFIPGIPNGNEDEHKAGSGYSRVYADPYGNVTINPHSGNQCSIFVYKQFEAERLREYLEGGNCVDTVVSYSPEETQIRLKNIQNVVMYQNDKSVMMDIVAFGIISAKDIGEGFPIEPTAIAGLLGFELNKKSIVLITCAWSWEGKEYSTYDDDYAKAERIIIVLEPQN